jgi:hypothetical protein
LLDQVLASAAPDEMPSWKTDAAAAVLLARYHRRRLPMRMLVPHLWHKLRINSRSDDEARTADPSELQA